MAPLTEEQRVQIPELFKEGSSKAEIHRITRISRPTIDKVLTESGEWESPEDGVNTTSEISPDTEPVTVRGALVSAGVVGAVAVGAFLYFTPSGGLGSRLNHLLGMISSPSE